MSNEIICNCMEVTHGQIVDAIKEKNCKTFEDIQVETEAGTVCGACEDHIQDILDEHLN
ncbi:MAG: (2Fe-2S)-binding protein [Bacteroidales bacterium]|nr:(2Fe-2S)-binding protein [Bacteroidales bacterium]